MALLSKKRLSLNLSLALLFFLLALIPHLLWIRAFYLGFDQAERVEIFKAYFPSFLGIGALSLLVVFLCLTAIFICIRYFKWSNVFWKMLSVLIIFGSTSILLLVLFGLM